MGRFKFLIVLTFMIAVTFSSVVEAAEIDVKATERESKKQLLADKIKIMQTDDYFENLTSGLESQTATTRVYKLVDGQGDIYRSYYKLVNNYWFHYKNEITTPSLFKYAVEYYQNNKNCKTGIQPYSCAQMSVSDPKLPRIAKDYYYDYYFDENDYDNDENDAYLVVSSYLNNDYYRPIREEGYFKDNRKIFINKYTLNKSSKITKKTTEYMLYDKSKLFSKIFLVYKESNKLVNGWIKIYDSKQRVISYVKLNSKENPTYSEYREYHKNNKVKTKEIYKYNSKGVEIAGYYTSYKSNGKKVKYKRLYYKKGLPTKMVYYKYNKVGQLKSDKNGKAYKYVTYFNKDEEVKKVTKAQYNKKGKLGKKVVVKATNDTASF